MMRFPVVSAAVSVVLAPTLVACSSTEPPADSPLTGEWVSENDPWVQSLALDLSEGGAGEVSGSFTTSLGAWRLQGMVEGAYAHPEVRLTLKHQPLLVYGRYTGQRVDHNVRCGRCGGSTPGSPGVPPIRYELSDHPVWECQRLPCAAAFQHLQVSSMEYWHRNPSLTRCARVWRRARWAAMVMAVAERHRQHGSRSPCNRDALTMERTPSNSEIVLRVT